MGKSLAALLGPIAVCIGAVSVSAGDRLTFADACTPGRRVVIAAVGDLIFQPAIQRQVDAGRPYGSLWHRLLPLLRGADIAYGNLEGPVARTPQEDRRRLAAWARFRLNFSYTPALLDDLAGSGFRVLSTANNHALDRGPAGAERTIDALRARDIAFTGTRRRDSEKEAWSMVTAVGGLRIGWLACTYGTNGLPDRHGQVLHCYRQRREVLAELRRLAGRHDIDAVIFTPHWGLENSTLVDPDQEALAAAAIDAGATAVLGAHPHVLQRWEKRARAHGGEALIIYSLGNFVSDQPALEQRTGMVALIELVQPASGGKARIAAARYTLTRIAPAPDFSVDVTDAATPAILPSGNRIGIHEAVAGRRACDASGPD